jgi:hypothetical protein
MALDELLVTIFWVKTDGWVLCGHAELATRLIAGDSVVAEHSGHISLGPEQHQYGFTQRVFDHLVIVIALFHLPFHAGNIFGADFAGLPVFSPPASQAASPPAPSGHSFG